MIKETWEVMKDIFNCVIIKSIKFVNESIKRKKRAKQEAEERLREYYWYGLSRTENKLIQELFKEGSVVKNLLWWCNECKEQHTETFQHWLDNDIITREVRQISTDNIVELNYNYNYIYTLNKKIDKL